MRIAISGTSYLRRWITTRSFLSLLLIWAAIYIAIALVFAEAYRIAPSCAVQPSASPPVCERGLGNLVYFSFTTQSTLGYGDYLPVSYGRWLSGFQTFMGLTMNAIVLGIVAVKALKPPNPIIFSDHLVYDLRRHEFWMRFVNVAADSLREGDIQIEIIRPVQDDHSQTAYDTQTGIVKARVAHLSVLSNLRLFAPRTESNDGERTDVKGDFQPTILAPEHLSHDGAYLMVTVRGYFESTGDQFFCSKRYTAKEVRCGGFEDVDNNTLDGKSDSAKARYLSLKINQTVRSTTADCAICPHHSGCEFDVAKATRLEPPQPGHPPQRLGPAPSGA